MDKKLVYSIFFIISSNLTNLGAEAALVMYLKQPSKEVLRAVENEINQQGIVHSLDTYLSNHSPAKITKKIMQGGLRKNVAPTVGGFLALYSGYSDYSNNDGLISFPLRHTSPKVYVVITPKIHLEKIKGETIAHPELAGGGDSPEMSIPKDQPNHLCKTYVYEKKESSGKAKAKYSYWQVREVPLAANRKINPLSIILLTNPANIYIETKDYLIEESPHMHLPSPYVVGTVDNEKAIIEAMDLEKYFEPITTEKKVNGLKKQEIFQNH